MVTFRALDDMRDALTGQALASGEAAARCTHCHVYYKRASVELLGAENSGRCVACGAQSIVPAAGPAPPRTVRTVQETAATTLADYRSKVGQLVTFEGRCAGVRVTPRGPTLAAMFETGHWNNSFKLVFHSASIATIGAGFIWNLAGRQVRVRGVVTHHPVHGYEIVITDGSMIQKVW